MPTWSDLVEFFNIDGWEQLRSTGHQRFEKVLPDGTILVSSVSHKPSADIPASVWPKIWKHQLKLASEDEFRVALRSRRAVTRTTEGFSPPANALPLKLVLELERLGVPTGEALGLDTANASILRDRLLTSQAMLQGGGEEPSSGSESTRPVFDDAMIQTAESLPSYEGTWYGIETKPYACPADGCDQVFEWVTAIHLVVVAPTRDDPRLLKVASTCKEQDREPRIAGVPHGVPTISIYEWEALGRPVHGIRRPG